MRNFELANVAAKEQICYSSTSARNPLLHGVTDPWCGLCKPAPHLPMPGHAGATRSLLRVGPRVVFLALLVAAA